MADTVSRRLQRMHDVLSMQSPHRGIDCQNLVVDLSTFCLQSISQSQLALCSSVLFNKTNGIINFLHNTVAINEFTDCKAEILKFLKSYVQKIDSSVNPYAVDLKDICVKLFTLEQASKVKVETFPLLVQILETKLEQSVVEDLGVPSLIDKYFTFCIQSSKQQSTVRHWIYATLGVFAERFPEHMVAHSDRLISIYINILKSEMISKKSKKPDMTIIAGCLKGLTSFLVNFTHSSQEGSKYSKDIYTFVKMAINPQVELTRYEVPRAGLNLFAKHCGQLIDFVTQDYQILYDCFYRWCHHQNKESRYAGLAAMDTFMKEVSRYVYSKASENDDSKDIFKYFIKILRSTLDNSSSDTYQMTIGIKGYGYFAKCCKIFLKNSDLRFMFTEMMQRSEQIYLCQGELMEDRVNQLPNFLEALSYIIEELDEITDGFCFSLERLIIVLFENFPKLSKGSRYVCCQSIFKLLFDISSKGAVLKQLLSQIVYQGLIRTCSHPVLNDQEFDTDSNQVEMFNSKTKISYKDFLHLWESLLDKQYSAGMPAAESEKRQVVHEMIYNELIKAILRLIHKLDLTTTKCSKADVQVESIKESSVPSEAISLSDPVAGLEPKVQKDVLVFINLVEFSKAILPQCRIKSFEQWIYVFVREIIIMSSRFPVISGFYKLLQVCMKISKDLSYFKDTKEEEHKNAEDMETEFADNSDCTNCFVLFRKFTKEVLVRMKQFKDDLLLSCLELVLSLPCEIVVLELANIVPALEQTFKLGLSYPPLAQVGLETLEVWIKCLPNNVLVPYFKDILPCFDGYLKSVAETGAQQSNQETKTTITMTSKTSSRGRKIPVKLLAPSKAGDDSNTDGLLSKIRLQMLHLLGSLGGSVNMFLLGPDNAVDPSCAVAWDTANHLSFAVPFQDMKPTIYLDSFLPRVVELATTSCDRQTKVAACELLHSLVHFMLGKGVTQPEGGVKSPMEKLWKKIIPVLMQLACDVEMVSKQLFRPLVSQLIHWFTGNRKYESPETISLLDAMMEGVIHPTNAVLRDFTAECLCEFLRWSIKQTTQKNLAKSPHNIKSLLKRLYSLALHPSSSKRLGAALAFNNIYTVFREESSLVDMFVLEILVTYLESLAMAHGDNQAQGTQEQCKQVIGHLERIIKVKAVSLNKANSHRRIPRGFESSNNDVTLSHMLPWLIKLCGKPQTQCRHECMRLVCQLAPLLPGTTSASFWMSETRKERPSYFIYRFEGGGGGKNGILTFPTLQDMGGPFSLKETLLWYDFLLASLDCYTWAFGEKLLSPKDVFVDTPDSKYTSSLFQSLQYFLSDLAMLGIQAAYKCFNKTSKEEQDVFSPKEMDEYNRAKCTVIVRLMNFLSVLLHLHSEEAIQYVPNGFWSKHLFNTVLSCMLEPAIVGFNVGDVEVIENLPEQTKNLCVALKRFLPKASLMLFKDCLARKLALGSHCNLLEKLPIPLSGGGDIQIDNLFLAHLVNGYQQLLAADLLIEALQAQSYGLSAEACGSRILKSVYDSISTVANNSTENILLTPASHQLALKLLELAMQLGLQNGTLERCILESSPDGGDVEFGISFFRTFQSVLNSYFFKITPNITNLMTLFQRHPKLVCTILSAILDQVQQDKNLRSRYGSTTVASILESWTTIGNLWISSNSIDFKYSLLELLRKVLLLDSSFLSKANSPAFDSVFGMYSSLLTDRSFTLAFKSRGLELLPFFTRLPENHLSNLKSCLDTMVANCFPLRSNEFIVGSPKYTDYITAFDKILAALISSGSLLLLNLLTTIMCREEIHIYEDEIQSALTAFITKLHPSPNQAKQAIDICFEVFCNDRDHLNQTRRSAIMRMCIPLLCQTSKKALVDFFCCHIKKIMNIIEAKSLKPSDVMFENQAISKLCCFKLIEVLYTRLNKSELNTPQSLINQAYCDAKTGKEMTMAITKCAHSTKSENMQGETVLLDLRRQLHCYAYNALVALISCTQIEQKFYVGFLFTENTIKGQFLLDNLIDCNRKYEFETVLSAPIAQKKQMMEIRNDNRTRGRKDSGSPGHASGRSLRYLSSQYLADSSLSEEVSNFDFSTPIQAFAATDVTDAPPVDTNEDTTYTDEEEAQNSSEAETVEMDELNQHECMGKLCGLIKHLSNSIPLSEQDMPLWMNAMHKKFLSYDTHMNIKLFIAKVIVNEAKIFKPFARFWLTPLMEMVLEMFEKEDCISKGINYFIVDVLVTVLFWSSSAIPEDTIGDRRLSSRLFESIMRRTHHETRAVFRNNLEIVKTMAEVWKDRIEVPTKIILEGFCGGDPSKKDNATGIQLLGVILTNGFSPFNSNHNVDKKSFYSKLVNNLSFKYKDVHAASAEVIGMMLKQLANDGKLIECPLEEMVVAKLQALTSNAEDTSKYITCIHKIQINFPPIVDKFINRILFILPTVHGSFKTLCLEIILSRVGQIPNVFQELKSKGLKDMLGYRDDEMQIALLKIIHGLLEKLSVQDLQYVMPSLTAMSTNPNTACRELLFDILIWIYDIYRNEETFREEVGADDILASAKDYLLQGLMDENKELRLKIQNFWSDETRLPNTTLERLVDVLRAMYSPKAESQYLSYTTNLILHLTSVSPDFNRLIFEQPLSECKFEDYPIDYSWHQRNATMTPLFTATQGTLAASQSQGGSMEVGVVRATQTRGFTPTQDLGKSQTFDWLNPSSQVESGQSFRQSFVAGTSEPTSSLLFASSPIVSKRKYKQIPHDFGSKRLGVPSQPSTQADSQGAGEQQEILRLKRRFLKDDTMSRSYFVKREAMRKKMKEEMKSRQQAARDSKVVMYRKYRVGDLPDIQIKYSELITPLQAVAQNDSIIAKLLFSALVQAIFTEADQQGEETVSDIQSALTNMATTSTQYFAPFISSIQGICFNVSQLSMEPSLVSTCSITSLQHPIGIMLLEKQLLKNIDTDAKKRKRARVEKAPKSQSTETWLELAKLYRSIEEYDVLQGIFSDHIGTQTITKKALECEARGDYAQALKFYNQAMSCDEWGISEPLQEEEDLWDKARLECFNNLSQWDNLDKFSAINIDDENPPDLEKIWSDTYYQEHYLPFVIRSKLKQYCHGGDGTTLRQFLNHSLQLDERRAFLESRHSEELALLHILHDDYDRARYYVANCLQGFLMDWSGLNSMMVGSRLSKLQSLQTITEMKEFLDFIANEGNFSNAIPMRNLFEKWLSRLPDPKLHPITLWDDVITNRCVFMQKMIDRFSSVSNWSDSLGTEEETPDLIQNEVRRQSVLFQLKMAETAKEQSNFHVSFKHLREALKVITEDLKDENLHLQWTHVYAGVQHKKCHALTAAESIETAVKTISELETFSGSNELVHAPTMALRHHILKSRSYDIVFRAIETEGDDVIASLDDVHRQRLTSLCTNTDSTEQIVSQLMIRSFTSLQNAIKSAEGIEEQNGEARCSMVEALMAMVKFCDSALRRKEDDPDNAPEIDVKLFPGFVVLYVLKAMTYDSEEARQRFPRLLQLVEMYPDTVVPFSKKASAVPCWMFIGWINQIVALMDKKEGLAIHDILLELASNYPQALCFPLKISSEQFVFDNTKEGKANKELFHRLRSLLQNPLLDEFVAALELLQNPALALKDWGKKMELLLGEQKCGDDLVECYKDMYRKRLDCKGVQRRGESTHGHELGAHGRKFAEKIVPEFEKTFGKDGIKLKDITTKKFDAIWSSLRAKIDKIKIEKPPGNLKEFSPWLANFQSSNNTHKLEIPGQYTGHSKPLPEYHVKIAGFDERVSTMPSIRKPKRIIIRGDDEKEYMFLVKGGEDLRLDQRIEQLFCIMNGILMADPACRKRKLRLRTYQVIPMTPRVGIIEWMKNTKPLKEVIIGETDSQHFQKAYELHEGWLRRYSPGQQHHHIRYGAIYSKASRTEAESEFIKKQGVIPWDILRRAFEKLSASPEAFLMLRSHFARTHACLCVCNYLLGIGDRHLSNLMIDTVTGGMVGIDFGHSFGSATQFLPVPELVPFRLTRQIVNLLLPLKDTGLLRSTMIHTLRALRENHELLLNTMDVFVKEPSLDWKVFARTQAKTQGIKQEDEQDVAWYPREKVNTAKNKFLGANPAYITRDEIRLGHSKREWLKKMEAVCIGDKSVNIRAREPENGLSVETQVDCLIDQATDANILGRTYQGWDPWV